VLDVRLPDGNGIELCRDLLSRLPDLRCLMLTSFTSDEAMLDAILAGASGYVVKDIKGMELAQAIKDVGAGQVNSTRGRWPPTRAQHRRNGRSTELRRAARHRLLGARLRTPHTVMTADRGAGRLSSWRRHNRPRRPASANRREPPW
jgi:DNA-binding NarL/FixJ family response regulator